MLASDLAGGLPLRSVEPAAWRLAGALSLLALALIGVALAVGPVALGATEVLAALARPQTPEGLIVWQIRVPRIVLAAAVGATLGLAGAALQGLLRNPLAEPAVTGTSGFAALGAVVTLYFGVADVWAPALPLGGILGALIGMVALLLVAGRSAGVLALVLAGLALGSLAGAAVALALNLSPNPFAALEIAFWLLGSLEDRSFVHVGLAIGPMILSWIVLLGSSRMLEALTLGEDVARTLGVPLARARLQVIVGLALGVGAAVAVSGVIGFIGLVVPHLVRPLVGHRPGATLVPSALGGACLLLAADLLVRVAPTTTELKVGVVTALLGVPFFLALVIHLRRRLT